MYGTSADEKEGYAWLSQGCDRKDANSCAAAAMLRIGISPEAGPDDLAAAERWLAQARLLDANGLLVRATEGWMEMTRERLAGKWATKALK